MATRIEKDSMGPLEVPADAYYGVQTQRAVTNFPISGWPLPARLIHAMGRIKRAAAKTNLELGLIDRKVSDAIVQAATEVVDGKLDAQFPVDIFQTGSGTSTNMNATEVTYAQGRAEEAIETLDALPLGGTAVGTGLNAHPEFAKRTIEKLSHEL